MHSKQQILDYVWLHSHFYHSCLYQCEELYREEKGFASVSVLFNCLENIVKSVIDDYDSRTVDIYKKVYTNGLITETEHSFLNEGPYCLRNIRNLFAHSNMASTCVVVNRDGQDIYWFLSENETSLLIYETLSDLIFNLILKILSSNFIEETKMQISVLLDEEIKHTSLAFKTLSIEEMLDVKGFPKDYFADCEDIPEHAKVRLLDNAPDLGSLGYVLSNIIDILRE